MVKLAICLMFLIAISSSTTKNGVETQEITTKANQHNNQPLITDFITDNDKTEITSIETKDQRPNVSDTIDSTLLKLEDDTSQDSTADTHKDKKQTKKSGKKSKAEVDEAKEKARFEEYKLNNGLTDNDTRCNSQLIYGLGIEEKVTDAHMATADEKKYCRRNTLTCCTADHYETTKDKFQKALNMLTDRFQIIEELLTLFKGPKYGVIIKQIQDSKKCQYIFESGTYGINEFKKPSFFHDKVDSMMSLLIDLEIYIKRQTWFFANFLCTICNPLNHKYFNIKNENTTLKVHVSTCNEIMEIKDFENRLYDIYLNFISKIANFAACESKDDIKRLAPMTEYDIKEQIAAIDDCYKPKFKLSRPSCQKICHKSLHAFEFPVDIFSASASALKIIYKHLTKKDIDDYYKNIKKMKFTEDIDILDLEIDFYETKNVYFRKMNFKNMEWEVSLDEGVIIFSDHMSKKYTAGVLVRMVGTIMITGVLLFTIW